jgi:hypothetical protein
MTATGKFLDRQRVQRHAFAGFAAAEFAGVFFPAKDLLATHRALAAALCAGHGVLALVLGLGPTPFELPPNCVQSGLNDDVEERFEDFARD